MQQKNQYRSYKGYDLEAVNIFWTQHLEASWQCNVNKKPLYARTAEEVFKKAEQEIDRIMQN